MELCGQFSQSFRDASHVLGQFWISSVFLPKHNAHTFKIFGMLSSHYWKYRIDFELWNSDQNNATNLSGPDRTTYNDLTFHALTSTVV